MEGFLELLGWQVSKKESKRLEFSKVFNALGARIDFGRSAENSIVVSNKDGRLSSVQEEDGFQRSPEHQGEDSFCRRTTLQQSSG